MHTLAQESFRLARFWSLPIERKALKTVHSFEISKAAAARQKFRSLHLRQSCRLAGSQEKPTRGSKLRSVGFENRGSPRCGVASVRCRRTVSLPCTSVGTVAI